MGRNGPALWDALLETVRLYTQKDVVVAGGCLRDFALGLDPKDIDLFVACESRDELEALGEALNGSGLFSVELIEYDADSETASQGEGVPDLIGVLDGEALGVPVNIVARTHHRDGRQRLLDGFDFNILKAFYSGEQPGELADAPIIWTPAAMDDLNARTATLTNQVSAPISYDRFHRFNQRNPGVLRMVDPDAADLDFI